MPDHLEFTKTQDRLLLQEAVAVRPFTDGKGWKVIATKLAKMSQFPFPSLVKAKTVRERILYLMEKYTDHQTESTEEFGDVRDDDMDEELRQLVVLRDEAVKIATNNRIAHEKVEDDFENITSTRMELKQNRDYQSDEDEQMQCDSQMPSGSKDTAAAPAKGKYKRKRQPSPKKGQQINVEDNPIFKFLEEREAKRLKLREEELALRREELEERKKLIQMISERLEDEKKIREEMFKCLNGALNK